MKHHSGVTLVEVLVSMVIMAIGLVSLAALQNFTLRYQLGSAHRAQLSGLLSDYAERVRSNLGQAPGVVSHASTGGSYLFAQDWDAQKADPVVTTSCSSGGPCSDLQLVEADMQEWRRRVRSELPRGSVWIAGDAIRGLAVTFMWFDKEFVASVSGNAAKAIQCAAASVAHAPQECCPTGVHAPAGVRCVTFSIVP